PLPRESVAPASMSHELRAPRSTPSSATPAHELHLNARRLEASMRQPVFLFVDPAGAVVGLAVRHRLPSMHGFREEVEAGGLMSYGAELCLPVPPGSGVRGQDFARGRPGDLPVEQPTRFELVINLKTARALGLTIPPSLLARADQVIE